MNHLNISEMTLKKKKASLVLKNAQVINVFDNTIEKGDIAIHDGMILGIGHYQGVEEIDLSGSYVAPGFIDSHVHIESSMLVPHQFARLVLPKGTTSVIADPHEITNICGLKGLDFMIESSKRSPLDVYMMMPSCVPATAYETSGARINSSDMIPYLKNGSVFGLGEMMDYPGVINGEQSVYDKLHLFEKFVKDGHAPFVTGDELNSYLLSGIETDHESSTKEEMIEKVKKGLYVLIREGSATRNVAALAPYIEESFSRRLLFCTDDLHPSDILKDGHINHNVNLSISCGVDPLIAIQMATINASSAYGIKRIGAIAPGYFADLIVFDHLNRIEPRQVFKKGIMVARDGHPLFEEEELIDLEVLNTVHINREHLNLDLPLKKDLVHVIGFEHNNVTTKNLIRQVLVQNGLYVQEADKDLLKIAVIERHFSTENKAIGLIEGYGLKGGAIALTIAHDSHNLICIGDCDTDMLIAIDELIRLQGGICLVKNHKIVNSLQLEVGGVMTSNSAEHVDSILSSMENEIREMGVKDDIADPFLNLAFLSLPVIPSLKLTDKGLFDVDTFKLIPMEDGE